MTRFYVGPYKGGSEVYVRLFELDQALIKYNLLHLIPFNHTYGVITRAVVEKLGTGYFSHDELMQKLDVRFASYYFTSLEKYINNEVGIPPAWQTLFEANTGTTYQAILMGLGVNAHVNNDLSQALHDVIDDLSYKTDFGAVNKIIHACIPEVIYYLKEASFLSNSAKNLLLPFYSWLLDKTIKNWRDHAWEDFIRLNTSHITIHEIEKDAQKRAHGLIQWRTFF